MERAYNPAMGARTDARRCSKEPVEVGYCSGTRSRDRRGRSAQESAPEGWAQ